MRPRTLQVFVFVLSVAVLIVLPSMARAAQADWAEYLGGSGKSGYNAAETIVTAASTPKLSLRWTAHATATVSTQPVQAFGRVFWGSWDGYERATNFSGKTVWRSYLGASHMSCDPGAKFGVTDTPKVATIWRKGLKTDVMWVGGGDAAMYALNADSGKKLWRTPLSSDQGAFIWSSPTLYHGSIFVGLASVGDCPLVQGRLYKLNALSGKIQRAFAIVPKGCVGGGIWGSPTIDYVTGYIYVATGNAPACSGNPAGISYDTSVLRLKTSDLSLADYWTVPQPEQIVDPDFGSTPTLFSAVIKGAQRYLVGVANKDGTYYTFDRYSLAAGPLWKAQIADPGQPDAGDGSISPSAWDGKQLYAAGGHTTIAGTKCIGSLRALDPATGAFIWENCINTGQNFGAVLGAVMAAPGVAFVAAGIQLRAVATDSGKTIFTFHDPHSIFYGAATIANGGVYIGDTYGSLFAFSPPVTSNAVSRFVARRTTGGTRLQWTMGQALGITGFRLYAGTKLLTPHVLRPSPTLDNSFLTSASSNSTFRLEVVGIGDTRTEVQASG